MIEKNNQVVGKIHYVTHKFHSFSWNFYLQCVYCGTYNNIYNLTNIYDNA